MSTRSQGSRPPRPGQRPQQSGPNRTAIVVGVVAVLVLVALVVAVLAGGGDDGGDETSTGGSTPVTTDEGSGGTSGEGSVTVGGDPLPQLEDPSDDPAVGEAIPTISGTDIDGNPITIEPDGRAKMIVVLAHWCPHCQAEVPVIVDWVADGGLPDDVDIVGIATANSPNRPNFPAKDWLDGEGWDAPTLLDDDQQAGALAVGTSAYPFMVVTNADGEVVARTSGELSPDQLSDLVAEAEGS
jgi:cytochrome c biogenesis protein CcmG, thiol:disulfide interchange protein DsbE